MDSVLPEWYGHNEVMLETIVKTGTIALDANVMLDLYRVGREQRKQIFSVLRGVQDRLFIPYQAAYEFQKNRLKVAADSEKFYTDLSSKLQVTAAQLDQIRDPKVRAQVQKISESAHKKLAKGLAKLIEEHVISFAEVCSNDPVRSSLDELISDVALGRKLSDKDLRERKKVAEQRSTERIPPGYAEKNKDDWTGDYLIWAELLDHMRIANRPLLFITNDDKEDWTWRLAGRTIGPRPELIAEMRDAAPDQAYHHVTLGSFLTLANKYLDATVEESTIDTVETIARPAQIVDPDVVAKIYPHLDAQTLEATRNAIVAALDSYRDWPDVSDQIRLENWRLVSSLLLDPEFQSRIRDVRGEQMRRFSEFAAVLSSFYDQTKPGGEPNPAVEEVESETPEAEDMPEPPNGTSQSREND